MITDWYGQNSIGWGSVYAVSEWGNANESNYWGVIFPARAGGSLLLASTTLFRADTITFKADATEI